MMLGEGEQPCPHMALADFENPSAKSNPSSFFQPVRRRSMRNKEDEKQRDKQ